MRALRWGSESMCPPPLSVRHWGLFVCLEGAREIRKSYSVCFWATEEPSVEYFVVVHATWSITGWRLVVFLLFSGQHWKKLLLRGWFVWFLWVVKVTRVESLLVWSADVLIVSRNFRKSISVEGPNFHFCTCRNVHLYGHSDLLFLPVLWSQPVKLPVVRNDGFGVIIKYFE